MYIDISEAPHVAVAAAIAGHKPIAVKGNVELHIDAAAGSGEKAKANLRTDANKLAPLLSRNGELAFLVEYRGGASTTKNFINTIKFFLEKDGISKADVQKDIKDAFPHLQ